MIVHDEPKFISVYSLSREKESQKESQCLVCQIELNVQEDLVVPVCAATCNLALSDQQIIKVPLVCQPSTSVPLALRVI